MRYLVSVDLDDTLLNKDKEISDYSVSFIQEFVKAGNLFIINTGRPFMSAVKYLRRLNIDCPIICSNGGVIAYFDKEHKYLEYAKTYSLDRRKYLALYEEVKEYLLATFTTSLLHVIYDNDDIAPFLSLHKGEGSKVIKGNLSNLAFNPTRGEFYLKKEDREFVLDKIKASGFFYTEWEFKDGYTSFELLGINGGKGSALKRVAKEYQIDEDHIYAFGDNLNDLDHLEAIKNGVAIANACDDVKKIAKYITKDDCNHDGVVNFLKELKGWN